MPPLDKDFQGHPWGYSQDDKMSVIIIAARYQMRQGNSDLISPPRWCFSFSFLCAKAEEARGAGPALSFCQSVVCSVMDSHEFTHTALKFTMSVTDPAGNTMLNSAVKISFRLESFSSGWYDNICARSNLLSFYEYSPLSVTQSERFSLFLSYPFSPATLLRTLKIEGFFSLFVCLF